MMKQHAPIIPITKAAGDRENKKKIAAHYVK